ncbi:putative membrane protein [Rickettsia bellii str. RML Mogi]|uniref:Putative membrane protein n=1 Tax=Rickettsia bellii str. RML Mogi TaxID=1359194 RepID=A0A0F3QFT0_RICBE|nr:putative membrane protein [Rickettsia bellii str. RML Mogi]
MISFKLCKLNMYSSFLFLTLIELALTVIKFTVVLDLGITSNL